MSGRTRMRGQFAVTKAVAQVIPGADDGADDGPGSFSLILSTDQFDRDGESVASKAFDPLPDHISMDVDHGMSVLTTAGSGQPFYNDAGQLQVDGTYASTPLGQEVRTLVNERHIRTASVAMIPTVKTKSADGKQVVITKADLLNGAFTPVPSNTSAVILASKSVRTILTGAEALMKEGRRNSTSDQNDVQSIHDLAAGLGATCGDGSSEAESKSVNRDAEFKSIIGSLEAQQDRVRDALDDAFGDCRAYLRGVLPETVVYEMWGARDLESGTYSQTYTDDGAVVTLTGDPQAVDIHEVVAPDADADREGKSAADAAAQAAADAADDTTSDDDAVMAAAASALKALRDQ